MNRLTEYRKWLDADAMERIRQKAEELDQKSIAHVSSTFYGGGVAEMLSPLIGLMNDVGVRTEWRPYRGSPEFFTVTKKLHNALQGDGRIRLTRDERHLYEQTADENLRLTSLEGYDAVYVHDPQPAPLITHYSRRLPWMFKPFPVIVGLRAVQKKQPWIWRCHLDLSRPDHQAWQLVRRFASQYDAVIVSSEKYRTGIRKPHYVFAPAIDPLSPKNRPMSQRHIERILDRHGIPTDKPLIAQVSRFDPWKDPQSVITAFRQIRRRADCHLLLLGSPATDDPQGDAILSQVHKAAADDSDITVLSMQSDELVNAVQRHARVIIQKSLREGFGLTVSEALWKGTPVVGSDVGGIPRQIIDGKNGFLTDGIEQCAQKTCWLLEHPKAAREMGRQGHEHVRRNFLITRLLEDHLGLLRTHTRSDSARMAHDLLSPDKMMAALLQQAQAAVRAGESMLPKVPRFKLRSGHAGKRNEKR